MFKILPNLAVRALSLLQDLGQRAEAARELEALGGMARMSAGDEIRLETHAQAATSRAGVVHVRLQRGAHG
ncbi:hypothetical protein ACFOY2_01180 [Nonomuraea purpurea]|uniref:Uncharacterized protein n=1 Tax=Nonomuraea purpurea TaxID=1849276 RepID=A0ABV8FZW6_9ACTN